MCQYTTVVVPLGVNLAPVRKSLAAPAGFHSYRCRSASCLLAAVGCKIFSKGLTLFLLLVIVVEGKNQPPYPGEAGEMVLPSFPVVLQLDRLSGQCPEAGGEGLPGV